MNEQKYIDALKTGDTDSLRELTAEYGERLLKSAYWFCGNALQAEDLVQETFLIAVRSIDQARFCGSSRGTPWCSHSDLAAAICRSR